MWWVWDGRGKFGNAATVCEDRHSLKASVFFVKGKARLSAKTEGMG